MRVAVLSDIHGNLTALEAVEADLRQTAPDLIVHGGDLADGGARPAEVVDRIRELGWQGIVGNTDEMLFRPESLAEFAAPLPQLQSLFLVVGEMADAAREQLGEERLAWLRGLPREQRLGAMAMVHATPGSLWRAPSPAAADTELLSQYSGLERPVAVYAHIHRPYVRELAGLTVVNTGSLSLSYDGDPRASYLLLDDATPSIRRVEYDLDREQAALSQSPIPHTAWVGKMLGTATFQMP